MTKDPINGEGDQDALPITRPETHGQRGKQNVLFDTQVLYIETIIYNLPEPPDEKVVNGTLINWLDKAVMARLRASHHLLALCPRTDFLSGIDIHRREMDPRAG